MTLLRQLNGEERLIGSSLWWEKIASQNLPLITYVNDQFCSVIFLWQDPEGDENHSNTASVLLNVNSVTNHHSWEPKCLERIAGTDVWVGQLEINATWRGGYSFIPLAIDQLPEGVKAAGNGSRESQRNWWIDVVQGQVHDPLNLLPVQFSGWGMSSSLHLPNAPIELGWSEWEKGQLRSIEQSQITLIDWQSQTLSNQRRCGVFSTSSGKAPLVVLLDGQKWGAKSGTLSVLQYLTDTKKIAPAHYLLVPSVDSQTRWKELSCHRPFWQALINELLPSVKKSLQAVDRGVTEHVVAGQSLGGLSALYASLYFADYFSKVISLSGSFWWPEQNRIRIPKESSGECEVLNQPPVNSLADLILKGHLDVTNLQLFQTVGLGEKDMCLYNDQTFQAIKDKGGRVSYEKVSGGHDWLSWRSGLMNGLIYLIPSE